MAQRQGPGVAIQAAFFVERRSARRNHPSAPSRRRWGSQLAASGFVAAAGAMLVLGGYDAASHGWWPTGTAAIPATIAITVALRFNRQAVNAQPEPASPSFA